MATSPKVAKTASKQLSNRKSPAKVKQVAASALSDTAAKGTKKGK